jgi:hypothetical protein
MIQEAERLRKTHVPEPILNRLTLHRLLYRWPTLVLLVLVAPSAYAQQATSSPNPADNNALQVNWLYGAFVPKDVPLKPLTQHQRWQLYTRMTYTTWGIYIKTGLFTVADQIANSPPEWKRTPEGFVKRVGTREAQFVIQNSFTALGDTALGWEIRYDRCRCNGFWSRNWHAIVRNFVTYGGVTQNRRPQIMPYVAAFAAGVTSASWQPGANLVVKGYQSAITQVGVGVGVNWVAEFAPDIKRILRIGNRKATASTSKDIVDNGLCPGSQLQNSPQVGIGRISRPRASEMQSDTLSWHTLDGASDREALPPSLRG